MLYVLFLVKYFLTILKVPVECIFDLDGDKCENGKKQLQFYNLAIFLDFLDVLLIVDRGTN